jgi:thymidylate synthase (FAD)
LNIAAALQAKHKAALMAQGMDEMTAGKKAEKLANEDARFVLPNACETKMVVTMNARSLNHFFRLRCCRRAQWEIRALAEEMLRLVYPIAPNLFAKAGPGCVAGGCTEGKMSCGQAACVREHFQALKEQAVGKV